MKVIAHNIIGGNLIIEIKYIFCKKKYVKDNNKKYLERPNSSVWFDYKTFEQVHPYSNLQDVLDRYFNRLIFFGTIEIDRKAKETT